MLEISLSKIKKNFGFNKAILDGFSLDVMTEERIALIGPNGSGKTTLFNIIMGIENINDGNISIRKDAKIGMLSQIPPIIDNGVFVKDYLIKNLSHIFEIEKSLRGIENKLATSIGKDLDRNLKKYALAQEKYEQVGGYEVAERISKICKGFKLSEELLEREFNKLSGGEKTIVSLAALMITEPDILLLDEPTNHLDIDTLEWFETYLKNYKGTIIISSHDRYFLDRVVTKVVLISHGKEEIFFGNYTYYLKENERRIMNEFADFKNQQKQIEAMKAKIKQLQEFGKLAFPGGEPFFRRAASIQKRLDKSELLDKPEEKKDLPLTFEFNNRSGNDVLKVNDLNLKIGDRSLLEKSSFYIGYKEKACLMGKNGSGKSTFVKALLGNIKPASGVIKIGNNVTIGYIPQEIIFENNKTTVLEEARKSFSGGETELRASLAKFYFQGELVFKRIGTLSGGEKVRLKLFELIQQKANFLILDEPTNHIDIDTKEMLEDALLEFTGTLLFISHDRYFINKLANKILMIENNNINIYLGNYDEYKEQYQIKIAKEKK